VIYLGQNIPAHDLKKEHAAFETGLVVFRQRDGEPPACWPKVVPVIEQVRRAEL